MRGYLPLFMLVLSLVGCSQPVSYDGSANEIPKADSPSDAQPTRPLAEGPAKPGIEVMPVIPNRNLVTVEVISPIGDGFLVHLISAQAIEGPQGFLADLVGLEIEVFLRVEPPFDLAPGLRLQGELVMEGDESGQRYVLENVDLP